MKSTKTQRAIAVAKPKPDRRGPITIGVLTLLISALWIGQAFAAADDRKKPQDQRTDEDRPNVVCEDWVPAALDMDGKRRDLQRSRPIEGPISAGDCITV